MAPNWDMTRNHEVHGRDPARRIEGGRRPSSAPVRGRVPSGELVTIVTVVFNGAQNLRKTIESVHAQSYSNLEYIVIDGGSRDGSIEILREMDEKITYWISEADAGIYDAMNKGISLANGGIIGILNSDDCYLPYAIEEAVGALRDPSAGYCYGWIRLVDRKNDIVGTAKPVPRSLFDSRFLRETPLPHPTMFVRSHVYRKFGHFDSRLRLAGDFEFIARIHKAGVQGKEIPRVLVDFTLGGASQNSLILREVRTVALREGLSPLLAWSDWLAARTLMMAKLWLPAAMTGWLRALKDLRHQ